MILHQPIQVYKQNILECADFLSGRMDLSPEWGIITGTGQSRLAGEAAGGGELSYTELSHFPRATSTSNTGKLSWGRLAGVPALIFQGRFHAYEGYTMKQVTMPVRLLAALGVKTLVVTNAAGGLNPEFAAGDLMLISDHINFLGDGPLTGENVADWGPRFPDMSRVYDRELLELAAEAARNLHLPVRQGVYVAVKGPHLETPAETRMLRLLGADAVGMSTVPEAICAVHAGLRILGISIISNVNFPDDMAATSEAEIIAAAAGAEPRLVSLLLGVLAEERARGR